MIFLVGGVVLWSFTHLLPAILPGVRTGLVSKLGEGPFKGLFSLDILIALGLIVFGWKAATPSALYAPPLLGSPLPAVLMVLAILLFVASALPNNIRRFVRHPQMTAVILWGIAHLISNGDSRSVTLFGGLTLWAILEIIFINRRDGAWQKPGRVALLQDIVVVLVAAAVFAALVYFHAALFGVSPLPA